MDVKTFKQEWEGKTLTIEVGRYAHQADAACTVRLGDTVVLATVVMDKNLRAGLDFFPLSVEFEERYYAAGKIKGSRFIKKEGRPSDEAVLAGRMIDRSIRPLFPQTLRNDVQVVLTVLSFDDENDPDVLGVIGASAVLHMSNIPWNGPIGAVRVGKNGKLDVNPTYGERKTSAMDLVVCGTKERVLMLEAGANIVADDEMTEAIEFGLKNMAPVVDIIEQIRRELGAPKLEVKTPTVSPEEMSAKEIARAFIREGIERLFFAAPLAKKTERSASKKQLAQELVSFLEIKGIDEKI